MIANLLIILYMLLSGACHRYCGYEWYGFWVPGFVSQETRFAPLPQVVQGGALYYAPRIMEATVDYYGLKLDHGEIDAVSLLTCAELGQDVWLKRPGHAWEGPFLVADCSDRADLYGHVFFRPEVVEVGFKTAVSWGLARDDPGAPHGWSPVQWRLDGVQVSRVPPSRITAAPVDMREWFTSVLRFARPADDKCRLVYRAPEGPNRYPLWRINCNWRRFYPPVELRPEKPVNWLTAE